MALTQAQWYEKIKKFVPLWYFESEYYQLAYFQALAKVLAQTQADMEEFAAATFIEQATTPYLELHGDERNVDRITDEEDSAYATRIRYIANSSYKAALKRIIDAILIVGECEIREGWDGTNPYLSRGFYFSRDEYFNDYHYNVFTVLIEAQLHDPFAYFSRSAYLSREDYLGSDESASAVYDSLEAAIDKAKALGVMYKIVETT